MKYVDEVRKRAHGGWTEGVDELSIKDIPLLLRRIDELESALVPFARQSLMEKKYKSNVEMVSLYRADCDRAFDTITTHNGTDLPYEDFGIPAE